MLDSFAKRNGCQNCRVVNDTHKKYRDNRYRYWGIKVSPIPIAILKPQIDRGN